MTKISHIKVIVVAGARPNFIKIGPLMKRLARHHAKRTLRKPRIHTLLVHTGQHYDDNMSKVFFQDLGIREPDINLGVGSGTHAFQTANIMIGFEKICEQERPDWVMVVGDVNSTMACAIVCAKLAIRIAHIEAGLRSFDRTMPEEINRVVTDALADLLFTPSEDADQNLLREGVPKERIKLVGNIMIDSLLANLSEARSKGTLDTLKLSPGSYAYVTIHRPLNVDRKETLSAIMACLERITDSLTVVFPVHPRTKKMISEYGLMPGKADRFLLLDPIGYHDSLNLTENARLVLTDSGGLQEESTFFRTPCLTLRPNTERPITTTIGSNKLTNIDTLTKDVLESLNGPERKGRVPPFWDGLTSKRILDHILKA